MRPPPDSGKRRGAPGRAPLANQLSIDHQDTTNTTHRARCLGRRKVRDSAMPIRASDGALLATAIEHLISLHGNAIAMDDLPWLGELLRKIRQGHPLTAEQLARISAIRAALTRRYVG